MRSSVKHDRCFLLAVWVWVVAWPLLVTLGGWVSFSMLFNAPAAQNLAAQRSPLIFAGMPFVFFGLMTTWSMRAPWSGQRGELATALVLMTIVSAALWATYFLEPVMFPGGGANIGLALILMSSVVWLLFLIPVGMGLCRFVARRRRPPA